MKWSEYQRRQAQKEPWVEHYEHTNIECPRCNQHIYRRIEIDVNAYPIQRQYVCKNCGWQGRGW